MLIKLARRIGILRPPATNYLEKIADCIGHRRGTVSIVKEKYHFSVRIQVRRRPTDAPSDLRIAEFRMQQLSGCCGVIVSYHAWIDQEYRKMGLGKLLNKLRCKLAKDNRYGLMLCTDVKANVAQKKILDGNGWTYLKQFVNPKTAHTVCLHAFDLTNYVDDFPLGFDTPSIYGEDD